MTSEDLAYLKANHPDPEPPRRSRVVDLLVWFDHKLRKNVTYYSPHSCGGSFTNRVQYEYDHAEDFIYDMKQEGLDLTIFDGKKVLDIGCGWGGKLVYFSENTKAISFDGFDPGYEPAVAEEFARQHGVTNCTFKTGYGEKMSYDDQSFDLVMMNDVLEHVQDPEKTMQECWRVLRPGGNVMIRFPSFKMMKAHHLDRAIELPAMHYLLPMKTWAAGLNYRLLQPANRNRYVPFSRVVSTQYNPAITNNLNGLEFAQFKGIIDRVGFRVRTLRMMPYISDMKNTRRKWLRAGYLILYRGLPFMQEFLSYTILFIGQRPS